MFGFLSPSQAWLFALLAPLIAFYFLKLRRPRAKVSSLALWRQVVRDPRVNSPFQRFKRNLLLLVQILLLCLLAAAAMRPYRRGENADVRRLPVLIDVSASMGALDAPGGGSRLAAAKAKVRALLYDLPAGQEIALLTFARTARRRTDFTDNKRILREALDAVAVEDVPSGLEDVLRMAQALGRTAPFDEVLLVSDGNLPSRAEFEPPFKIRYERVAPAGPNVGITALNARRAGRDWHVFVRVEGSPDAETGMSVELRRDGEVLGSETLSIAKGGSERLVFQVSGDRASALEARLVPDGFDSLAADNATHLDLPAARSLHVHVPPSLGAARQAFRALGDIRLDPGPEGGAPPAACDLVVTDRAEDLAIEARTRMTFGLVPDDVKKLVSIGSGGGASVDWRRSDPLLQHVELADLTLIDRPTAAEGVLDADFENIGWDVLVNGRHGPLLLARREGDRLRYALLFHPDRSTLPYRVGFPILMSNLAQVALAQAGLAEAQGVRSLLDAGETSLASVDRLELSEGSVAAASEPLKTDKDLSPTLALLAFGVLLSEWWLFHRRAGGI